MIRRLYVHNYRCLENFELPVSGLPSALLIGKNGAGKTTVGLALELLQRIARGTNRVRDLVQSKDITRGRADVPTRFEIEVELDYDIYTYSLAFEFPKGFRELRIYEEKLLVDGEPIYTRETSEVRLVRGGTDPDANFRMDWHLVALPIIQRQAEDDPLYVFKKWLANTLILRPVPMRIRGASDRETLEPNPQVTNFGAWFSGLVATAPAAYGTVISYVKEVMPDLQDVKNPIIANESRNLTVQFSNQLGRMIVPFEELSDGEKCFFICGMVIAANDAYGPLLCFWDEPDNYLSPSEVGASVIALRRAFKSNGQLIVTSHNPEAIRRFSDENTLLLSRDSHLEPTTARLLKDVRESGEFKGNLVDAMARGDVGA